MQYLGGKSKLAKRIVDVLPIAEVDDVWEPFMGGGAITAELARRMHVGQHLTASDDFVPLVAMWIEALHGWEPPIGVTDEERRAALDLPDTNPCKAFMRIGAGFGGNWRGGFARFEDWDYSATSARVLAAQVATLRASAATVSIELRSFFDVAPCASDRRRLIYCDPPYAGTAGYPTGPFDHERFWRYCREWRRHGARVYVSEFSAPDFAVPVWQLERKIAVNGKGSHAVKTDTLYEVQP